MWQLKILVSIVKYNFHHVATQNPGHGTKFVTLPSSILLYWFYWFAIKLPLLSIDVVSTSPIVWSQMKWFFLMRIDFCTINHDEII